MSKITIELQDTDDGLVAVETTIEGFDPNSKAQQMAGRINSYIAHIGQAKKEKRETAEKPYAGSSLIALI